MEDHNPNLNGYYWGWVLVELCKALRILPTKRNKQKLHNEFKEYLKWPTISNNDDEQIRLFIKKVLMVAAREKGIYIRTSDKQPELIEEYSLGDVWKYL